MTLSRRRFLGRAVPLGALPFLPACAGSAPVPTGDEAEARSAKAPGDVFAHGVASGDPLVDAVMLWTRVTPPEAVAGAPVSVDWRMASDPEMTRVVATGTLEASAEGDYTVKVDVPDLAAGTHYYYDFSALGARSASGRTKTLPSGEARRARLAVASCANYPAGYFNVYRFIAARNDLDLVLHLGDYLYEYANGTLGDGAAIGRLPAPDRELLSLEDYRSRHAQYKTDPDLRELHRQHPVLAIWDDHEIANNGYRDGAGNHQESEGDWQLRKQSAMRAYFEWMPIRPSKAGDTQRIYRQFAFGDLFDLILLDTRYAGRSATLSSNCDRAGIADAERSLLGAEQEDWFFGALRASSSRGARWRLVAQQVMLGQRSDLASGCVLHPDQWDGYPQSRARALGVLRDEAIDGVVVLTGDAHSSWAMDIAEDPFDAESYDAETGRGSLAVEVVAPSVSSPFTAFGDETPLTHPHLKFVEQVRHGYVLVDVTTERVQAEWYLVSSVLSPSASEELAAMFETRAGDSHLVAAREVSVPSEEAALPAR